MFRIMLFVLTMVMFPVVSSYAHKSNDNNIIIKSLNTQSSDSANPLPVADKKNKILIQFDIDSQTFPNLSIKFVFCNKDWNPYNSPFISNKCNSVLYNIDVKRLPQNCTDATYSYKGVFPNDKISFALSGKWKYFITDAFDTSKIYAIGKFISVDPIQDINVTTEEFRLSDKYYYPSEFALSNKINIEFDLIPTLFPVYVNSVEIIDNAKTDYCYVAERKQTENRGYEWNASNQFNFYVKDVMPNNEYRVLNLSNKNKYMCGRLINVSDGYDVIHTGVEPIRDNNGRSILFDNNDPELCYLDCEFKLKNDDEYLTKKIYLIGSFNNWTISADYLLKKYQDYSAVRTKIKRGIYDYQYVVMEENEGNAIIDPLALEGNSYKATHFYNVFLYYSDQELGCYDRIIGYKKIYK